MSLQVAVEEDTEMQLPLCQRPIQAAQLTRSKGRRLCLHLKRLEKPVGCGCMQWAAEQTRMLRPSHLRNYPLSSPEPSLKTQKCPGRRPTCCQFTSLISLWVLSGRIPWHKNPIHPAEAHFSPLDPLVTSAANREELSPSQPLSAYPAHPTAWENISKPCH